MISAFLVDLDGTILDSRKPFLIAHNRALAKNGLPPLPSDEGKAIKILRRPASEILPQILGERCRDPGFVESFTEDVKEAYVDVYLSHAKLCPSAKETIQRIKAFGRKVGIVSSRFSFADCIIPVLANFGLDTLVDLVVTSRDVTLSKPSPEPFLLAARKLNKPVPECVVVGDSPDDILAGKAAGMITVGYTGGFYSMEELSGYSPDLLIGDLTKLALLAQNGF